MKTTQVDVERGLQESAFSCARVELSFQFSWYWPCVPSVLRRNQDHTVNVNRCHITSVLTTPWFIWQVRFHLPTSASALFQSQISHWVSRNIFFSLLNFGVSISLFSCDAPKCAEKQRDGNPAADDSAEICGKVQRLLVRADVLFRISNRKFNCFFFFCFL